MYWETIQAQGYTNKGMLLGDWMGREAKGGQVWITYHLTGNGWIQGGFRNQRAARDFIADGTTLNDIEMQIVKRFRRNYEVRCVLDFERWKAPVYESGPHSVTNTTIQLTWFPQAKRSY